MTLPTHPTRALALTVAVLAVAACSGQRTAERADSDLAHDLALASQVTAQPALQDTAIAPAPQPAPAQRQAPAPRPAPQRPRRQPVPQPVATVPTTQTAPTTQAAAAPVSAQPDSAAGAAAAPAPAPAPAMIAAGTGISLSSGMRVCTNSNKVGDKLVATVTAPVQGSGGAVIPAGARVVLEVAQLTPGTTPDSSTIVLQPTVMYLNGLSYDVMGTVAPTTALERTQVQGSGLSDKEKVAGGAVVGAILGQLLGHNTQSTVIGAAAGAATGAVVAKTQEHYQACLPEGAALTLTLSSPLTMN